MSLICSGKWWYIRMLHQIWGSNGADTACKIHFISVKCFRTKLPKYLGAHFSLAALHRLRIFTISMKNSFPKCCCVKGFKCTLCEEITNTNPVYLNVNEKSPKSYMFQALVAKQKKWKEKKTKSII